MSSSERISHKACTLKQTTLKPITVEQTTLKPTTAEPTTLKSTTVELTTVTATNPPTRRSRLRRFWNRAVKGLRQCL